jgi:hypothetical protein
MSPLNLIQSLTYWGTKWKSYKACLNCLLKKISEQLDLPQKSLQAACRPSNIAKQ